MTNTVALCGASLRMVQLVLAVSKNLLLQFDDCCSFPILLFLSKEDVEPLMDIINVCYFPASNP